ncbi:four helix bundle protein [Marivirga salinae]|uniref:Four helix bundle protein n=1 Tax=Marivirga salinarum TaxID=3059078 RepID=A0AA49JH13_9BACT|nr:four helix bundle protein [Marivirga sp. BDSF4-3]WKK77513.1 four helix bundle protein [Marivirga sp. BDSF4-3]
MKSQNIIQLKSYQFALEVIKIAQLLKKETHFEISSQILRSGTSVGANVEEAIGAQSRKDFIAKLSISYKEARETHYWLRLIKDSGLLEPNKALLMIEKCEEILKIIGSIQKTIKAKTE